MIGGQWGTTAGNNNREQWNNNKNNSNDDDDDDYNSPLLLQEQEAFFPIFFSSYYCTTYMLAHRPLPVRGFMLVLEYIMYIGLDQLELVVGLDLDCNEPVSCGLVWFSMVFEFH